MVRARQILLCSAFAAGGGSLWILGCSSSDDGTPSTRPTAGSSSVGAVGGTASGGSTPSSGGSTTTSTGGASVGGNFAIGQGGSAGASAGSSGSAGASVGGSGGAAGSANVAGAGNGTAPTCTKSTPSPNDDRAGECDYLLQSIDFEDEFDYPTTPADIKITSYGSAFGQTAINDCSPYCYGKNLTVGIDIVGGGSAAQLQGEVIVEFPKTGTGLPITVADMSRNSLAWITFDGAAKPAFEIDTQLVIETASGVVPS
ncbi:MAG TPA: hypothetical protein VHV51_19095, partial [Polyangiaceae bacterium]|nr:hypothetical protein [Polyangiaceae bacterium]